MKRLAPLQILLTCLAAALSGCDAGDIHSLAASSALVRYDDFSGSAVDGSKWVVDTTGGGTQAVSGGVVVLGVNAAGASVNSTLAFPAAFNQAVRSYTSAVTPLAYSQATPSVRYRHYWRAYKDSKYAGGGLTSDVISQIRLRDNGILLVWEAMYSRCMDATCTASEVPFTQTLGMASLGQSYRVTSAWDGATAFTYTVSGVGSVSVDVDLQEAFGFLGPAGAPQVKLEAIASEPGVAGQVSAAIDYVDCVKAGNNPC